MTIAMRRRTRVLLICAGMVASTLAVSGSSPASAEGTGFLGQDDIVSPQAGDERFGIEVTVLDNGNYVVSDRGWDSGTIENVGAVYLYDGMTDTLISTLTGSQAEDGVGPIIEVGDSNFLALSQSWDDGTIEDVGAVTWIDGKTGLNGVVSKANSLHGTTAGDRIGTAFSLDNGNYVVSSSQWDDGSTKDVGAVVLADGNTGITGPVTTSNSLHGSSVDDKIGGTWELDNGDFLVLSWQWDDGATEDVGAATLVDGTTGLTGPVTKTNSLHGTSSNDRVGLGFPTLLTNGNYVINSSQWNGVGASTWVDGNAGLTGPVTTSNSLYGAAGTAGLGSVVPLSNGNYVTSWPGFDNGGVDNVGAVTLGNGTTGTTGAVSTSNSLYGVSEGDGNLVRAYPLTNGNYVTSWETWDLGAVGDVGAVTWANGTTGLTGPVTISNSLHGSALDDNVGEGVIPLANGNYVVSSPIWDFGAVADVGAATWANGTTGLTGPVTASNSLYGTTADDQVGIQHPKRASFTAGRSGITALENGNYVVPSMEWDSPSAADVGAVTWANGATGVSGPVTMSNSLHGTTVGDLVGGRRLNPVSDIYDAEIIGLPSGNYVVPASEWDNGSMQDVGASIWVDGSTGLTGPVTTSNSLYGASPLDTVGSAQTRPLETGDYIVRSFRFDDGATVDAGAFTFGFGLSGITGPVSRSNSAISRPSAISPGPIVFQPDFELTGSGSAIMKTPYARFILMRLDLDEPPSGDEPVIVSTDPARFLDTRPGQSTIDGVAAGDGAVAADSEVEISIAGRGDVPADAEAVVVNVTAINPAARGFVTMYPCGERPLASSLNYGAAGAVVGNEVLAKLSTTGSICAYTSVATQLTGDVVGYVPSGSPYVSIDPARLLDTRVGQMTIDDEAAGEGPVAGGMEVELQVTGRAGVPTTANAAVLNVTAINPAARGFVTIYTCGERPLASSLNYASAGAVAGNEVIAKLSAAGTVCIYTSATTHLTADLVGHLPGGTSYSPLDPARLLDTRAGEMTIDGVAAGDGRISGDSDIELTVTGRADVPADAKAVVLNVTAINPDGRGFVTISPCGERPLASSLNYASAGAVAGNEVIAKLSAAGSVCIYTSSTTHLTADIVGHLT